MFQNTTMAVTFIEDFIYKITACMNNNFMILC